ncbi:Beta-lactamase class C [Actinokineospora spheciospongiae]|uniref:Beta-lactamase class C n=1 Tax=Actinokineospora spheciospongiae TaxID=909613 RepID=W7IVV0_9PSEU|nr:serine hydrolase domain-containing protein [Actinokineospora spheciospongiae]EWC64478.1 Beta-lactamase class C [Actinokineospora spheciospongiae]
MTRGGFSEKRLSRVRDVLERHVDTGAGPGAVAVVARRGEVYVEATGMLAFDGPGSTTAMGPDTLVRIASMTKSVVAACAMALIEDGTLRLDDPVDPLLPELADMTVLADPDGPLEDTVPAERPITVRDLLTCRLGTGTIVAEPGTVPVCDAIEALGQVERPGDPDPTPDEWIRRVGDLPLVCQPGRRWLYNTGPTAMGVLISRATGMSLGDVLRERICEPLGMRDTALTVDEDQVGRLATPYIHDAAGELVVEPGSAGVWRQPAAFKAAASGLVSTAEDCLAFASALLAGGAHRGQRVLSRPAVSLMTSDQLTSAQKAASRWFWPVDHHDDYGWGFGMEVHTRRANLGPSAGSYGWYGKYGTAWANDPAEDMTLILMLQRPFDVAFQQDFWTAAYQAIDD